MRATPPQNAILVRSLSVAELAAVLTDTLATLSPTRVSIVSDQLRAILHSDRPSDLIAMAALPSEDALDAGIIAIATLPEKGDTGTILHVDWARPSNHANPAPLSSENFGRQACGPLRDQLLLQMSRSGVRFVQWATDPIATNHSGRTNWPDAMRFENVGTLDYLAVDSMSGETFQTALPCPALQSITLVPLDHQSKIATQAFESLVSLTYENSLDCPNLESYRRTDQILESYRCVSSFAPDMWFSVHNTDEASEVNTDKAIGCCLLARHTNSENEELVLELVYMGIIPSHRGQGLGKQLMQQITQICHQHNAARLVLAVDQNNHPALASYKRFGMQPLFSETVWVRSL